MNTNNTLKMIKNTTKFLLIVLIISFTSCKDNSSNYPMEKPVWDLEDYKNVSGEILYNTPDDEKLPGYSNNQDVFLRLTDKNNISAILDDENLGLEYRKNYSDELFSIWRSLVDGYSLKDKQDNFVYPQELVKIRDWGYFVQIKYFNLGNNAILQDAVNPDQVKDVITDNEQIIVDNFIYGISFLTDEHALDEAAISAYSNVLMENYELLIKTFPNANYSSMLRTIEDMNKKLKSEKLKSALNHISELIKSSNDETN